MRLLKKERQIEKYVESTKESRIFENHIMGMQGIDKRPFTLDACRAWT